VYLDVTVVDKRGVPVVSGLNRDDFTVTEDGKPQRIFSFEPPQAHNLNDTALKNNGGGKSSSGSEGPEEKAPETILLLDLLNTRYDDFSFVRDQAHKFLAAQPETMPGPTELMVLGNSSLKVLQESTRSRQMLLNALEHLPRSIPFKANYQMNFLPELVRQSYDALQQISIQHRGVQRRENVIWLGMGAPAIDDARLSPSNREAVRLYVRDTVNMMVESRITLFQISPGLEVLGTAVETKKQAANIGTGKRSTESYTPFAEGDRSFTELVEGTGGKFFNENDVTVAIAKSEDLGSNYYTLTYQPETSEPDGRFKKIRVALRDPNLSVLTKAGFFAREKGEAVESDKQTIDMLRDVALATVPFSTVGVRVAHLERHPDSGMVEVTLEIDDRRLQWQAAEGGRSRTTVLVFGVSRSGQGAEHENILATRVAKFPFLSASQKPDELAVTKPKFKMTLPYSRQTKNVRLAVAINDGDRIGAVDFDRKAIDAAPETATANPALQSGRTKQSN
jgi:VWFA-related protein